MLCLVTKKTLGFSSTEITPVLTHQGPVTATIIPGNSSLPRAADHLPLIKNIILCLSVHVCFCQACIHRYTHMEDCYGKRYLK